MKGWAGLSAEGFSGRNKKSGARRPKATDNRNKQLDTAPWQGFSSSNAMQGLYVSPLSFQLSGIQLT